MTQPIEIGDRFRSKFIDEVLVVRGPAVNNKYLTEWINEYRLEYSFTQMDLETDFTREET